LVTGGGGVVGLVAFFDLFFFLAGFLPFSTLPEPSDSALPGVGPFDFDFFVVPFLEPDDVVVVLDVVVVDVLVGFCLCVEVVDVGLEVEVEVEVVGGCWTVVVTVTAGVVAVTGGQV
jgi:hypothetical protein